MVGPLDHELTGVRLLSARRAVAAAVALLLSAPLLALAAPVDEDRLPAAPVCGDPTAVTRDGAWAAVRGPRFVERPLGQGQDITAYVVSPHDQRRVFATNGTSIVRSQDGGCTWREVYVLPPAPTDEDPLSVAGSRIRQLVVPADSRAAARVLVLVQETSPQQRPHVLISEDGSDDSFVRRDNGLPQAGEGTDLVVAPTNADFVWLSVRFTPAPGRGPADEPLPGLPPLPPLPGVTQPDPGSAPRGGLYASTDGGRSWESRLDPEDAVGATSAIDDLVTDPLAARQLWAVTGGILRHSDDGGRSFRAAVPSAAEQRERGWRVTTLVVDAAPERRRAVYAFTATSAQGGGPRLLTSTDGGASFEETPAPGPVDAATLVGTEGRTLAVSVAPTSGKPAAVAVQVGDRFIDVSPPTAARTAYGVSSDRTDRATLHARTPRALLRYVGRLVTPPPPVPPQIGAAVADADLPPLGVGRFTPSSDDVVLRVGERRTVPHRLEVPRRATPLDLYFLVDTTISMKEDLPGLSADVDGLVRRLRSQGVDLRVGLGEFKGQESTLAYRRIVGIGPDVDAFSGALQTLRGDGFGLEMQLIGLEQALTGTGEQPAALVPASCKANPRSPDRFVQDERRTAPLIPAGQQADFSPSHVKVVVMVTDTVFLRPAGTRLKPDCTVDTDGVAEQARQAGVKVVGVGIDDVNNPRTAEDLLVSARRTGALMPDGRPCAAELADGGTGAPAVCRTASALAPALLDLVEQASEPAVVTIQESPPSPQVSAGRVADVDLRRPKPVDLPVTYTCGDEPGTSAGAFDVTVRGSVQSRVQIARLPWRLRCVDAPVAPDVAPLVQPPAIAAVAALPLLPPGAPPPPPPAQGTQVQTQTQPQSQVQSQVQSGTQEQEQAAAQLALAVQEAAREEGVEVQGMSARRQPLPTPVWLLTLTALTAVAGAAAVHRQQRAVAVVREPVGRGRPTRR